MLFNIFPRRPDHPLADSKELKRILLELRPQKAAPAVDEIGSWLDSLAEAEHFRLDHYFDLLSQLDNAAQAPLRRLRRDYLQPTWLSKPEEERQWQRSFGYFRKIAALYATCLERARLDPKNKGSEIFKSKQTLTETRLQAARYMQLKWLAYRYTPAENRLWRELGQTYLAAEDAGHAQKIVTLYPSLRGASCVAQQYLHALVHFTSGMDSLLPHQIELADHLITHFLPGFALSSDRHPESIYWIDTIAGATPTRLIGRPAPTRAGMRFFSAGNAVAAVENLLHAVERGNTPADLDLGGETSPKQLLPVLHHLRTHWTHPAPQRAHVRHRVATRMTVLHGFDAAYRVFGDAKQMLHSTQRAASWLADNVSLGGFRASSEDKDTDWITLGTLLCVQAEGSHALLLGTIRRFCRRRDARADLGVQLLAKHAQSIDLQPRRSGFSAANRTHGIWLQDDEPAGLMRIALPLGSFNVRESMAFSHGGRSYLITPMELETSGADYEIARFRADS